MTCWAAPLIEAFNMRFGFLHRYIQLNCFGMQSGPTPELTGEQLRLMIKAKLIASPVE